MIHRPRFAALPAVLMVVPTLGCGDGAEASTEEPPVDPGYLAPPPEGQGFQLQTEDVLVEPGDEVQDCYFFEVGELAAAAGLDPSRPVDLHRVQIAQRPGSHHMNIFRVRTIVGLDPAAGPIQHGLNGQGECFKSPNWADWPLVANSQQDGQLDWTFPEGVVNPLEPDERLMLQTHYVNASTQKTPEDVGHVSVNFWTLPEAEVTAKMGTLFATKQSIRICQSNPTPRFEGGCQFGSASPVHVIGANGHFHSRGATFDMYAWDGQGITTPPASERFYASDAWDDPPMAHSPELDLVVPGGGGVWYGCAFEWRAPEPSVGCAGLDAFDKEKYATPDDQLDCCYTFGPIVEKNEHCNAFVYYYPKQDDVTCF